MNEPRLIGTKGGGAFEPSVSSASCDAVHAEHLTSAGRFGTSGSLPLLSGGLARHRRDDGDFHGSVPVVRVPLVLRLAQPARDIRTSAPALVRHARAGGRTVGPN